MVASRCLLSRVKEAGRKFSWGGKLANQCMVTAPFALVVSDNAVRKFFSGGCEEKQLVVSWAGKSRKVLSCRLYGFTFGLDLLFFLLTSFSPPLRFSHQEQCLLLAILILVPQSPVGWEISLRTAGAVFRTSPLCLPSCPRRKISHFFREGFLRGRENS